MSQDTAERWRTVSRDALAWREWDAETVVFNQGTGNTHLLSELGGEVLRELAAADHGASIDTLVAALSGSSNDSDETAHWTKAVAEVLSEFARLGLAQPDKS